MITGLGREATGFRYNPPLLQTVRRKSRSPKPQFRNLLERLGVIVQGSGGLSGPETTPQTGTKLYSTYVRPLVLDY